MLETATACIAPDCVAPPPPFMAFLAFIAFMAFIATMMGGWVQMTSDR